ncbi:MAG: hypothetical protein KDA33_07860, partial [Phycisphaerales bacterium]|nr:hypothetical protein [Phycisphaerales bacterium]
MTRMAYVLSMVALLAPLRSATADETEAKEILAQAQAAVKAAKSMSLEVSFLGDGVLGKTLPVMDATVVMMRGESGKEPMVQIQGEKTMFRANSAMPFRYVSDGVTAAFADDFRRIYSSGTLADANQLQERIRLVPPYFLSSDAFARELNAFQLSLAEPREIAGVKCHTIEVTYDKARSQRATICIGEDDLIVRSVISPQAAPITRGVQPNVQSAEIFMARNIMLNPEVDKKSFSLPLPKGYRVLPFAQPTPRRSTGMLAVGSKAPDWTLQD